MLDNLGHITVSGTGNEIENENGSNGPGGSGGTNIFTNSGTLEVLGGGVLTLLDDLVINTLRHDHGRRDRHAQSDRQRPYRWRHH